MKGHIGHECKTCVNLKKHDPYKKYGITAKQYHAMEKAQNNLCYLCNEQETTELYGQVRRLSIDHCHKTGKVRGLLCTKCNYGAGGVNYFLEKGGIKLLKKVVKFIKG